LLGHKVHLSAALARLAPNRNFRLGLQSRVLMLRVSIIHLQRMLLLICKMFLFWSRFATNLQNATGYFPRASQFVSYGAADIERSITTFAHTIRKAAWLYRGIAQRTHIATSSSRSRHRIGGPQSTSNVSSPPPAADHFGPRPSGIRSRRCGPFRRVM
jgi:hypothetical protein